MNTEPEFFNFNETQESIPPAYVAWRAGTITIPTLFLAPIDCLKIPAQYNTSLSRFLSYIDAHSF